MLVNLFQLESFVDKITFNFLIFIKIYDFVLTQNATKIFLVIFYVNPWSRPNENRIQKS